MDQKLFNLNVRRYQKLQIKRKDKRHVSNKLTMLFLKAP
jgi:hypothetical protein